MLANSRIGIFDRYRRMLSMNEQLGWAVSKLKVVQKKQQSRFSYGSLHALARPGIISDFNGNIAI